MLSLVRTQTASPATAPCMLLGGSNSNRFARHRTLHALTGSNSNRFARDRTLHAPWWFEFKPLGPPPHPACSLVVRIQTVRPRPHPACSLVVRIQTASSATAPCMLLGGSNSNRFARHRTLHAPS